MGYSFTAPVLGSSLPISADVLPVNQIFPSLSSTSPWGPVFGLSRTYSLVSPVLASRRPSLFASCPVHQMAPSLVAKGSWGLEPGVGRGHSLMAASAPPDIKLAAGRCLSGKFLIR